MDIETINDNRNNNINNYNFISNKNEENIDMSIFPKDKKNIFALNQSTKKNKNISSGELTLCEGRLLNDLAEFKRSKIIGKICKIKLYEYKKNENGCYELIVEFISFFSVKFIFDSDYPCTPPLIIYYQGLKLENIFDEYGIVKIESIKKMNWTPSIWLSTLVYSIELLISSGINTEDNCLNNYNNNNSSLSYFMKNKKQKYGKRKWNDYIEESKDFYNKNSSLIPELEKNIKQLKIK